MERIVVDDLGRLPQFSHAAVAGSTGDLVFVSGTLGTTEGLQLVEGGAGPQTTQAMANIETILAESGAGWADVVKVSVFLADMTDSPAMNAAYAAFFAGIEPPARITVGGVDLAFDAAVEIECIAERPPAPSSSVGIAAETGSAAIPRRTGFVEHDGEAIYFEVVGGEVVGGEAPTGEGIGGEGRPPLVLCHGAGGNHAVWFQQVARFAADRTVVTWDHRGYGRSTDRGDRSSPGVAVGDLLALLDHLGIERADLVGQSMGGWTVVGAVLERPELARRVVLADTLGGFTSSAIEAGLTRRPPLTLTEDLGRHPAIDPWFSVREPELAHLYQSLGRMGTADPAVILPRLLEVTHDESEAERVAMPVLCVVGDRDPLFPPASIRALADLLPDARVVEITRAGHSPYFEAPEMWNAVVSRFLR